MYGVVERTQGVRGRVDVELRLPEPLDSYLPQDARPRFDNPVYLVSSCRADDFFVDPLKDIVKPLRNFRTWVTEEVVKIHPGELSNKMVSHAILHDGGVYLHVSQQRPWPRSHIGEGCFWSCELRGGLVSFLGKVRRS